MQLFDSKKISVDDIKSDISFYKSILDVDGIILVKEMNNKNAIEIAMDLGQIFKHKDSDSEGIVHITILTGDKKGENVRGFTNKELYPHTDRAVEPFPPDVIILWCNYPAKKGGNSILVDGKEICAYLRQYKPKVFAKLNEPHSAIFGSEGRYYNGAIVETISSSNDRYSIRFRNDDLGFFSAEIMEAVGEFKSTIRELSQTIKLSFGEGYIALNTRWLHGRTLIEDARSFGRIHVNLIRQNGVLSRGFKLE